MHSAVKREYGELLERLLREPPPQLSPIEEKPSSVASSEAETASDQARGSSQRTAKDDHHEFSKAQMTSMARFREFEHELFRSRVYARNSDRLASVSSFHSTVNTGKTSILSHLTMAHVSIVSVLRLPVKLELLVNRSTYTEVAKNQDRFDIAWPLVVEARNPDVKPQAQQLCLELGITMDARRDEVVSAALTRLGVCLPMGTIDIYLRTKGSIVYVPSATASPLLLYSTLEDSGKEPVLYLWPNRPGSPLGDPAEPWVLLKASDVPQEISPGDDWMTAWRLSTPGPGEATPPVTRMPRVYVGPNLLL